MPTVLRVDGYRFYFYSHEANEPPHIHVDRDNATIKLWLNPVEVAKSRGFRRQQIGDIIDLTQHHREVLLEAWHEYFGTGG